MYQEKTCPVCGKRFVPNSGAQKRCSKCMPQFLRKYRIKNATIWNREHPEKSRKHKQKWAKEHPHERVINANKQRDKRRGYGYVMLNKPFKGSEGHHVDIKHVLFIPKELHRSIQHNLRTGKGMEMINKLAFQWLGGVLFL